MLIIGLTGGIASGKSTVSGMLKDFGVPVFDADKEAHRLTAKDGDAYPAIKEYFSGQLGLDILTGDGEIDRKKLGALVFADRRLLADLENILHGRVEIALNQFIIEQRGKNANAVILDIPLLIEKSWQSKVDKIWLVYLPEDLQLQRLRDRDRLDKSAAQVRLAAQMKLSDKVKHADFAIDNSGSLLQTKTQVIAAWQALVGEP